MKRPAKPGKEPSGPRRGAIPTPKEIIDAAQPFVPCAPSPAPPEAPKSQSKSKSK